MRLLDLFCGAGGAAMGYHQAGFTEIVGVDIEPQANYPFTFVQGDALEPPVRLEDFDLIHASPPCQAYSVSTATPESHPNLIRDVRRLIAGEPYVIENVPAAPLGGYVIQLCGSVVGLGVQRHRRFELSEFSMLVPSCNHKAWADGEPWQVTGKLDARDYHSVRHRKPSLSRGKRLMEMPWVDTHHELSEAIPPAYTKFIGEQFLNQLETGRV